MSAIRSLGIVGLGQMGAGILAAAASCTAFEPVFVHDVSASRTAAGVSAMDAILSRAVRKGLYTEFERQAASKRVSMQESVSALAKSADFIIEAAPEKLDIKCALLQELCANAKEDVILASNTSSISITKLGAATERPELVIGMHFFHPVMVMRLVEVVPGLKTCEETTDTTLEIARLMGKETALADDSPGFISNRLLMPYINEAVYALSENVASKENIDIVMKYGTKMPMGPLELADFIGLDTCLAIMQVLHKQLGDDKYRPAPLLEKYVDAQWLGKKSGRGFYAYPPEDDTGDSDKII